MTAIAGICARCGCAETTACLDALGRACWWITPALCSACLTTPPEPLNTGGITSALSFGFVPPVDDVPVEELLEFERSHPGTSAGKAEAVRRTFGIGFARWMQLLRRAVRSRAALEHDALLARHLREAMETRARRRAALITRRPPMHHPLRAVPGLRDR